MLSATQGPGTHQNASKFTTVALVAICPPIIDAFMDFTFIDLKPISAADNRTFRAVGKGMMRVTIPNGNQPTVVHLKDVRLYMPTIAFTLVLLSRADSAGYTTVIKDGDLHLLDRNHPQ